REPHAVLLLDLRQQRCQRTAQTGPHGVERVRPRAVDQLVLPVVAAARDRRVVRADEARLDPGGAELDTEGRTALLDRLPETGELPCPVVLPFHHRGPLRPARTVTGRRPVTVDRP